MQVNSPFKDPFSKNVHGSNINGPPNGNGVIMDYQDKNVRGNPVYQYSFFNIENPGNYGKAMMEHMKVFLKGARGLVFLLTLLC